MHEMASETATKLFLAHEVALENAAAKIYRLLTQDAGLTPAECFVVCLRAAAKFLAQHNKNEWREIIQHASELLLQHAMLASRVRAIAPMPNKPAQPEDLGGCGDADRVRYPAPLADPAPRGPKASGIGKSRFYGIHDQPPTLYVMRRRRVFRTRIGASR